VTEGGSSEKKKGEGKAQKRRRVGCLLTDKMDGQPRAGTETGWGRKKENMQRGRKKSILLNQRSLLGSWETPDYEEKRVNVKGLLISRAKGFLCGEKRRIERGSEETERDHPPGQPGWKRSLPITSEPVSSRMGEVGQTIKFQGEGGEEVGRGISSITDEVIRTTTGKTTQVKDGNTRFDTDKAITKKPFARCLKKEGSQGKKGLRRIV